MTNFNKTAVALKQYDWVVETSLTLEEMEKAEQAVKEAFAEDTKDINDKQTAMLVSPNGNNGWLRKTLVNAGHKDCGLTQEKRKNLGWGW